MGTLFGAQIEKASGEKGTVLSSEKASRNVKITAAVTAALIAVIGLFFSKPLKTALGVLFGTVIAELLFLQNEKSIAKMFDDPDNAKAISKGSYSIRTAVRIAALVIGYFNPYTGFTGTVLGLVSIPAAIYILTFISNIQLKKADKKKTE